METQNLVISFDYSWFLAKNLAYAECRIMKFHYRNSSNEHTCFWSVEQVSSSWRIRRWASSSANLFFSSFLASRTRFNSFRESSNSALTWNMINEEILVDSEFHEPLRKQIITFQKFNIPIFIDISIKTHEFVCIRQALGEF